MLIPLTDDVDKRNMPVITTIILALNLLVFVVEFRLEAEGAKKKSYKQVEQFVYTFGLAPRDLETGRYFPLITHMFVHGGMAHFLGNMLVFWAFALTVESSLGSFTFLCMYLIWGLAAALSQSAAEWGSKIPMIGASGAIAGVMGAYFVGFGARTKIKTLFILFFRPTIVHIPAVVYLFIWFATQMLNWVHESKLPGQHAGVAWMAHIGGFVAGALTMALVKSQTKRTLVRDKAGDLVFVEAEDAAKVAVKLHAVDWKPGAAAAPAKGKECSYCQTPLEEKDFVAANLAKCPSENCQRLTYMC